VRMITGRILTSNHQVQFDAGSDFRVKPGSIDFLMGHVDHKSTLRFTCFTVEVRLSTEPTLFSHFSLIHYLTRREKPETPEITAT